MSYWVLILILSGSGKSIDHVQFASEKSCMSAIERIRKAYFYMTPQMVCVPTIEVE